MNRNDLYGMAFRYKKAGIWKKLWDNEIFAIKLKNGEYGYISIMGKNGVYNALGLYVGEAGFDSYRITTNIEGTTDNPFKEHELLLQQRCLQVAFEMKDDLMPEEIDEVRSYAKKNDIKLSGKNAYPQFIKFEPGYHPWKVQNEEDIDSLYRAMHVAILLAEELETKTAKELEIFQIGTFTREVPLFEIKGEKLVRTGQAPLPQDWEEKHEYVKVENQVMLASIKKLPRKGIWESELICMMEAVQNSPDEVPYYPFLLLVVESTNCFALPIPLVGDARKNPQKVLQEFANAWKDQGCYPKEIRCRDERTYALLKDFCEKTGVKISIYEKLMPALEEVEERFLQFSLDGDDEMVDDQMEEVVHLILSMSKSELKKMPKQLVEEIRFMIEQNVFPKDIADMLSIKLEGI